MSGAKPQQVANLPSVRQAALDLARDMVPVQLTKFRFRMGAAFVVGAVVVFVASESIEIGKHFRPDFPDRAWTVTWLLFGFGAAFAGKEVIESLVAAYKSIFDGKKPPNLLLP
jgi:hypothetical protein